METCRICQQECSQDQQVCSNCGYPFPVTPTLDESSPWSLEVLSQREAWEKEIWQQYEQLQQQQQELSQNFQQLQQKYEKQQQEAKNNERIQQQIKNLQQELSELAGKVESQNQSQKVQQQDIDQLRESWQESQRKQQEETSEQYQEVKQAIAELQQEDAQLAKKFESQDQSQQQIQQQVTALQQENVELTGQFKAQEQSQKTQQQDIDQLREFLQENQRSQQETTEQYQQLQQEIAKLKQENAGVSKKLESQNQKPQNPQNPVYEVSLESAVGYDYTRLRDLLANQKWREADIETEKAMKKVAHIEDDFLREEDIDNFPCEDLRTIDRLWVKSSNGKFGFSVQKEIYQKLGGTREFDVDIVIKFGDTVGWRDDGEWLAYAGMYVNTERPRDCRIPPRDVENLGEWGEGEWLENTPEGHLPVRISLLFRSFSVYWCVGTWLLFSRAETCKL
ncbi:GUN4 domain-containing protein [Geitlerinema sp. PCC 9228]|uniref:GUN4 domain-containing protein n=1 Tax=Geitlerinema sp. PCC 9228 TaxID=111611 RepID=UPI0008F9D576|nr:GUN4 domain-containing protein [Geitlerinema sp. PCC 9228]